MATTDPALDPILPPPLPTRLVMPADGLIPTARAADDDLGGRQWQQPYVSRFVELTSDRDREAWVHFCRGHHVEFLYWQATRVACDHAVADLEAGVGAELWLARVDRLIRGSGALLRYCGQFDPEVYDPCLRTSMEARRDDFSGDMSVDFLRMMEAKAKLVEAFRQAGDAGIPLFKAFREAERYWHERHGEVILALHPGKSLLREKVERMKEEGANFDYRAYVENTVHGGQALADYDDYFGVERSETVTIDDYWTQAVWKLSAVHSGLPLEPRERASLIRGDAVLLAMVSEALEAAGD